MPQISLYIDEPTLKKVEDAASREHISISKWVADQLRSRLDPSYPAGYDELFGSVTDSSFARPKEIEFSHDVKREPI